MTDSANLITTTLRPGRMGSVLTGRHGAAELRREVERRTAAGEHVVLDFTGVSMLAPSFADELLAKLPTDVLDGGQVSIEHLRRSSAMLARVAIDARR